MGRLTTFEDKQREIIRKRNLAKEKAQEQFKKSRKPNSKRTLIKKKSLLKRDLAQCFHCKIKCPENLNPLKFFTIDHLMPLSLGGCNCLRNLKLACSECNHERKDGILLDRNGKALGHIKDECPKLKRKKL